MGIARREFDLNVVGRSPTIVRRITGVPHRANGVVVRANGQKRGCLAREGCGIEPFSATVDVHRMARTDLTSRSRECPYSKARLSRPEESQTIAEESVL